MNFFRFLYYNLTAHTFKDTDFTLDLISLKINDHKIVTITFLICYLWTIKRTRPDSCENVVCRQMV